jgi:hypothetical protein
MQWRGLFSKQALASLVLSPPRAKVTGKHIAKVFVDFAANAAFAP